MAKVSKTITRTSRVRVKKPTNTKSPCPSCNGTGVKRSK